MNELLQGIGYILRPLLDGAQTVFRFFMQSDLQIFGLPMYVWICGSLFISAIVFTLLED